jgi:large subunit ribosomal protein L15
VNLSTLDAFDSGGEVSPDTLRARGLVAKQGLIKVLARGELAKPLTVRAHAFSAAAVRAIEAAGGTAEVLELPWRTGRPPARGNALTNR